MKHAGHDKPILTEVPGKGWIARVDELHATAQGATQEEALENLRQLVAVRPDWSEQ